MENKGNTSKGFLLNYLDIGINDVSFPYWKIQK